MYELESIDGIRNLAPYVLKFTNVSKAFQNHNALEDISFGIRKGEIFGFLGPSGSGKTTTIKIATGQLSKTDGDAVVLGEDVSDIDEMIYEQIGIVTDSSGIYEKLSVYDNLRIFADLFKVHKSRIDELLKDVGLDSHKKHKAGKLSKGQKQRLVLARAILHKPKLLFLDEPTSGLDPATASQIQNMFLKLKEEGMSIFLTTHNMEEATKLCDTIALLNEGVIMEYGTPKEICLKYNDDKAYDIVLKTEECVHLTDGSDDMIQLAQYVIDDAIETIHSCEPTLEEVFIKVTGRSLV